MPADVWASPFDEFNFIFITMSWYVRSTFGMGLFGICLFSTSLAWAQSVVSEDNIVMEKIIYTDDMLPARTPNGMSKIRSSNDAEVYSSGERYFPVMLVSTSDYKALDSAFMHRMFNEKGFKDNGNYGSAYDYFVESSAGQFKPTFDIYPITLPKNFSNYNSDSELILPAIDILVERSDFKARASKYEKEIPFIILHPLSREKALAQNSSFFNHQYKLQYSAKRAYTKNGYTFNNYAFISQKAEGKASSTSSKDVNMLGTFVHEFSHVIGLQDTYSADEQGYATIGPLPYDVMALGLRNGNGGYPPTFSSFEREAVGWLKPTEITNTDSVYELKNLSGMQAYAVSNPNKRDEYFLIEYRPAVGFDSKIGSSSYSGKQGKNGVLIWYIDYDYDVFFSNDPNGDLNHQRVEVRTVLSKNQDSFANFKFVNKSGKAKIDGIFNLVFDGDDRVCFTVKSSKSLDKCPEKVVASSSSIASSSSVSSSSGITSIVQKERHRVQMNVSRGMLNVEVPVSGKKTLRFYDALGNIFGLHTFEGSFASVNIFGENRSVFVQLDVNGRMLLAKRVQFR
ncbi:M6 family metalloprotease domain-containing protein [Fibrobacter sp. UWB12]|nr:M6 family metalloprotease domain-containing protein [Fibrobacter sp. UWB12]